MVMQMYYSDLPWFTPYVILGSLLKSFLTNWRRSKLRPMQLPLLLNKLAIFLSGNIFPSRWNSAAYSLNTPNSTPFWTNASLMSLNSKPRSTKFNFSRLTENAASKEIRLNELESALARLEASFARISQEKELLERHNSWLNDELKSKLDSLIQLRKTHSELEAEMSAKLADDATRLLVL